MGQPEEPVGRKTVEMRKALENNDDATPDERETQEYPQAPNASQPEIRVPKPDPSIQVAFEVSHFRQVSGVDTLLAIDEDVETNPLVFPEGTWGEVEDLLAKGLLTEALPRLEQWESEDGAKDAPHLIRSLRIRAYLMEGKQPEAEALLGDTAGEPDMMLAMIGLALSQGDLAQAQSRLVDAEQNYGGTIALEHLKGLLAVSEGRMDVAMEHLSAVARNAPEHAVARHQLGQLVLANGDMARAGTLFEQAMEISPTFPSPALALAEMLMDQRQLGEAMAVLHILTDARPELLAGRLMQMRILLELGEADTALSLAELLRSQMPGHPEVCMQWAEAKARTGDLEESRLYLEKLMPSLEGALKARCLRLLSQIALGAEPPRVQEAIGLMRDAVDATDSPDEVLLELGQLQLDTSDFAGAKKTFEDLATHARDVGTMLSGAIAAHNRGLRDSALTLAEAAHERVKGTPAEPQIAGFLEQLKALGD